MKKIILADRTGNAAGLEDPDTGDVQVFKAYSNEEVLYHNQGKNGDLIISGLAEKSTSEPCTAIRQAPELENVSRIACRRENAGELSQCKKCGTSTGSVLCCAVRQLLMIPQRASCQFSFYARCPKLNTRGSFLCQAENISVTGMLIKTRADFSRGDRINFTLNLPYAGFYETQAEVVRAVTSLDNQRRYGLRFSRLEPAARHAIKMLAEQQAAIDGAPKSL